MRLDDLIFVGTQLGKRSLAIDLKAPAAREVLRALLRWADVVHLNVRSGSLPALGLDEDSVRSINPAAVHCHVSGFGAGGTKDALPVFDPEMQALAGLSRATAPNGHPPAMVRCAPTDLHGAMLSLVPTLLALIARQHDGDGAGIEVSVLGAALVTSSETLLRLDDGVVGKVPAIDDESRGLSPWYRTYTTSDGEVAVVAHRPDRRMALMSAVGATDPGHLVDRFGALTTEVALAALAGAGIPAEEVQRDQEAVFLSDPSVRRIGLSVAFDHPIYGSLVQVGSFWSFGELSTRLECPAPTLGQHSRAVLTDLGVADAQVRLLGAAGVVVGDAVL
jgi:crotonobetainyl-CoA:carnitine CoA-transferase CaiB-like acyl-CoA transferase